jgi:hypothetical protein
MRKIRSARNEDPLNVLTVPAVETVRLEKRASTTVLDTHLTSLRKLKQSALSFVAT